MHAMECNLYLAVARKGSREDRELASLRTLGTAPAGRSAARKQVLFHRRFFQHQTLFQQLYRHVALIRSTLLLSCGKRGTAPPCPPQACCPKDKAGGTGDPVNMATGEEEYQPDDDLVVYNPYGPAVRWGRVYNSLRLIGDGYNSDAGYDPSYQCNDFGVGWSQHYNVGVYVTTNGGVGYYHYVLNENGSMTWFLASSVPSATQPRVQCSVEPGVPLLVEWDYDPNNSSGYYTITFPDRSQWITTDMIPNVYCCALAEIRDRLGNAIYFNYTAPPSGFDWPLLTSISTGPNGTGMTLLTIRRYADGSGNIASISDAYGRSIYYNVQSYTIYNDDYPAPYQELESVSQVVASNSTSIPARYTYGYELLQGPTQGYTNWFRFLHTITVPSPTGSGTSTATINYDYTTDFVSSIVDANGNSHIYSWNGNNTTTVTVKNAKRVTVYSYTAGFDGNMSQTSLTNGAGQVVYTRAFGNSSDPYRPSDVTDGNGNTTYYTWDPFGHVLTEQKPSPRNTVTTYYYDYSVFPLGELKSVQEGFKSPTTYSYFEPSGLIQQIKAPLPGTTGSNSTVTYSFTWDSLGNPLTLTTPGNNAVSSITTTFNYGSTPQVGEPQIITDNLGKSISFAYDPLGRVSSVTDQVNHSTEYSYNLAGQLENITYPATGETGKGQSSQIDTYLYPGGPLDTVTTYDESDKKVRQVIYKYGKEGELLSRSGSTEPVTYTYDGFYRVLTLADGDKHKTTYTYNPAGFLASIKYPNGDTTKFIKYDALGNVLTRVDGRDITTNYAHNDPENLLTNITYPADTGHSVTFGYDAYGRRTGIADGTGVQIIGYDDNDLVTGVQTTYNGLPAQVIAYGYYPNASRQSMTTPAGSFAYLYDGNGLLHSLTNPFNETTTWQPTDNRLVGTVTLPDGVTSTYSYDPRNRISSLVNATSGGSVLSSFTNMLYDAVNNRTSMMANDGLTTYAYVTGSSASANKDELAQEQSARAGGYTNTFAYDAAFNPTTFRGATNTFNTDNQFTNSGYVYDGNGDPTTYQGATLAFDEENRLTAVGSSFTADYRGDSLRAWKQGANGKVYFLYDGSFPVCELDASGNLLAVNTFANKRLISRRTSSGSIFYSFDSQGNVAQKLDGRGNVLSSYVYDAFGIPKANGTSSDPFGFEAQYGYYTDTETGLQLLTHRYYDPGTGRFMTRDPISYKGGINLYAYVTNHVPANTDPTGYSKTCERTCNGIASGACDLLGLGFIGSFLCGVASTDPCDFICGPPPPPPSGLGQGSPTSTCVDTSTGTGTGTGTSTGSGNG